MRRLQLQVVAVCVAALLVCGGCLMTQAAESDRDVGLDQAYEQLYLARFGVEYPPRADILKTCREKKLRECLGAYEQVQQAKRFIRAAIEKDSAGVYAHVTGNIERHCPKREDRDDQQSTFRCHGAITALYFFTDPGFDRKMQNLVQQAPRPTVQALFGARYEWFYNRPQVHQWITLVTALPNTIMSDAEKRPILEFLEESRKTYEKFGVML